ncbi:MazG nucleotide pyrophosphohydrolase domain-containing protein [Nocardia sp. CDC160]|uniref:MazG nucleotide pyrophosphohydrolase domain-containing protein n=1 Tax=Nocardia sp. CDC160 TaxID=3112166 RepID=UPI002DBD0795|nr:MazG nucleotide pyrophosphohydrolase domain-containing protein [Nocardia sp. CDC160]MEC3916345.1 MazG nucleotide pyrophosphohydrolase domain-containing protein [Nocardia sp. CDC160]
MSIDMQKVAAEIRERLGEAGFSEEGAANRAVLALAEEAGEFVGAYRRWSGQARRTGTFEEMRAELADVVIVAWLAAGELGIDLEEAVADKLAVMSERGWRDPVAE